MKFISEMENLNFQHQYASQIILKCWFAAQKCISVENIYTFFFLWRPWYIDFQDSLMNRKFKYNILKWLFCNIINIFSLSSDQLNVSLLKYPADPKLWGALKREFSQKIKLSHDLLILKPY